MSVVYHKEFDQRSGQWIKARCGLLTASEIKLIMTPSKLEFASNDKSRAHVCEIAAQRINNYSEPTYQSDDMLRGTMDEEQVKSIYADKYAPLTECGFITNDNHGFTLGYSPDGLVGDDGQIEIKSRRQKFQLETVCNNEMPDDYMLQVQAGLLISGRKWCDFISYCGGMVMFVKRIYPDLDIHGKIIAACFVFERVVAEKIEQYHKNADQFQMTERYEETLSEEIAA